MKNTVLDSRVRRLNQAPLRLDGDYVLYWMTSARRPMDNFALQHAVSMAQELKKPLVVFEALRCGYRWASDRLHQFVVDGMRANQQYFRSHGVTYLPYLEPESGKGRGLLQALAGDACLVVGDYFPCFFLPRMHEEAASSLDVRLEQVDGNGVLPLFESPREFTTAFSFRRHLQKVVLQALDLFPEQEPLESASLPSLGSVDPEILAKWPMDPLDDVSSGLMDDFSSFSIDHTVRPAPFRGGFVQAQAHWERFKTHALCLYDEERNQPEQNIATGLSPYLHFGHISVHSLVRELFEVESWNPTRVAAKVSGSRAGWWGMSPPAEAFIDQVLTWRELGYTFCHHRPSDYGSYESLPHWAVASLDQHACDPRSYVYDLETLETASTHDPLWNAAQQQLVKEGRIHNYLRMLWGKKILEWTEHPRIALDYLIELNNKYALDGRNPNSYSGIFWTLGRFDRAWGPERPIFGKIRYMSSENTARKVKVKTYIKKWSSPF